VRDVARACRIAVENPRTGHDTYYIAAPETLMQEPSEELVRRYFPSVDTFAEGFGGCASTLNVRHAANVLGFSAKYSWRDVVSKQAAGSNPDTVS
jgi:nucleoside-diphosphate-sugar epimerase